MINKILVPTDGSELSVKAIRGAVELAKKIGAKIVGMTAIEPYSYSSMSEYRPESFEAFETRTETIAKERLRQVESIAKAAEVEVETSVSKSFSPYEAIIEAAAETGCDAIFMASHGRRGLNAVLLGSETQKVLTHTTIPVMVYR
ncbi:MAG TPA: universal stress protein [Burkholderiaceae bacterium]|jgi:nucleotide-binding universal stress UspA family protein|nr:universal stress protein [Burkholderiaceae bacterium]